MYVRVIFLARQVEVGQFVYLMFLFLLVKGA